jgi:hypothetical protein
MYVIGCLTEFSTYTLASKIVGVPLASVIIGIAVGFFWEWFQSYKLKTFMDLNDVLRTAIGTIFGGLFSLFIVSQTICIIGVIVSVLLVVNDFRYLFKK